MDDRDADATHRVALERFLAHELRFPLSTLARLGARLASGVGDLAAVGRALARESARLDVLVTNALEFGLLSEPPAGADGLVLAETVEKAVFGHRAWIEAHAVRVRVIDSSRDSLVRGERDRLLPGLFTAFGDLLDRLPAGGAVEVRVRDVGGLVRVEFEAPRAARANPGDGAAFRALREQLQEFGGELWDGGEDGGFGFALPRARCESPLLVRRSRQGVAPGR